jgi:hypothetical protein
MIESAVVEFVWDAVARQVLETIARKARADRPAEAALCIALAREVLQIRRAEYLTETALWLERELGQEALH